jgi:predicted lysophospholipase L1 biosynthesis ABC-type transport system permease subunit
MPSDLGDLIKAEVSRAESDFQAFRARAISVVAVAGGLVALVTGFLSVAAGSSKDILPSDGRWPLVLAVACFVLSTICALVINLPKAVDQADTEALRTFVDANWDDDGWDQSVARLLVNYLSSLREANVKAARWLVGAVGLEILGIAFTAVMAIYIVGHLA